MSRPSRVRSVRLRTLGSSTRLRDEFPIPRSLYYGGRGVAWAVKHWKVSGPVTLLLVAWSGAGLRGALVLCVLAGACLYGWLRWRRAEGSAGSGKLSVEDMRHRLTIQRQWGLACRAAKLLGPETGEPPTLRQLRGDGHGTFTATVKCGEIGVPVFAFEKAAAVVAEVIGCRELVVTLVRPGVARLAIHFRDPIGRALPLADLPISQSAGQVAYGIRQDGGVATVNATQSILIGGLTRKGKALALDTPVPTPTGWTTMGAIREGDVVYSETGAPCIVTDAWDVRYDRPCYRVTFSDGSSIVADAEHQWLTWDINTRKAYDYANPGSNGYPRDWATWAPRTGAPARTYEVGERTQMREMRSAGLTAAEVGARMGRTADAVQQQWHRPEPKSKAIQSRTTGQMAESLRVRGQWNHAIPAAQPLVCPEVDLPLDPYVLGYLLGDGDTVGSGRVACDPRDREWLMEEFAQVGHDVQPHVDGGHFGVRGLRPVWRSLGLSAGKHIPDAYFRGSFAQRLALVQGLVDSDGHVDNHGAYCFTNTNPALVDGFRALVAGLGCVTQVHRRSGRIRAGRLGAESWCVRVPSAIPLSRLPRKAALGRTRWGYEQSGRYIVSIEPVESVPVRCIAVDSPSHLFLVTDACIPTHNSNLVWALLADVLRQGIYVDLYVSDPKGGVELDQLEAQLDVVDGPRLLRVRQYAKTAAETVKMLEAAEKGMHARQYWMKQNGARKIAPDQTNPLVVVILDETLPLTDILKKGTDSPLGRVAYTGAAAAYVVWANTQVAQVDAIGRFRDLVPQRICFATPNPQVTDSVLGAGSESLGAYCSDIREPGVGYSHSEGDKVARKFRAAMVTDDETQLIAQGMLPPAVVNRAREAWDRAAEGAQAQSGKSRGARRTALYRWFYVADPEYGDSLGYVGISYDVIHREAQHTAGLRAFMEGNVRRETQWFGSRAEAVAAEEAAIRDEKPIWNKQHNGGNSRRRIDRFRRDKVA